jgi:hypothetical protein
VVVSKGEQKRVDEMISGRDGTSERLRKNDVEWMTRG